MASSTVEQRRQVAKLLERKVRAAQGHNVDAIAVERGELGPRPA